MPDIVVAVGQLKLKHFGVLDADGLVWPIFRRRTTDHGKYRRMDIPIGFKFIESSGTDNFYYGYYDIPVEP